MACEGRSQRRQQKGREREACEALAGRTAGLGGWHCRWHVHAGGVQGQWQGGSLGVGVGSCGRCATASGEQALAGVWCSHAPCAGAIARQALGQRAAACACTAVPVVPLSFSTITDASPSTNLHIPASPFAPPPPQAMEPAFEALAANMAGSHVKVAKYQVGKHTGGAVGCTAGCTASGATLILQYGRGRGCWGAELRRRWSSTRWGALGMTGGGTATWHSWRRGAPCVAQGQGGNGTAASRPMPGRRSAWLVRRLLSGVL